MFEFFLSGLRSGIRGRSVQSAFLFGLVLVVVAYLASGFSPRQPRTVALDIGFSGIRLTLILLALFWVQELVMREIDRKIILHSLALPVSRGSFLFGRYLAVVGLIGLAALILSFCLLLAVLLASPNYDQEFAVHLGLPFWLTVLGLAIDVAVVAAVAMATATLSTVAVMPMAVGAAFAIGGKSLGPAMAYLLRGADGDTALIHSWLPTLEILRWLMPDLSRLDWRDWALYGSSPPIGDALAAVMMAVGYAVFALAVAWSLLEQREFG